MTKEDDAKKVNGHAASADQNVVRLLEDALRLAKNGEIQGIAIVMTMGPAAFVFDNVGKFQVAQLAGLDLCKDNIKMAMRGPVKPQQPKKSPLLHPAAQRQ